MIQLLARTLDMAYFYLPEHTKTLENSRRLASSKLSLVWHGMKTFLSAGCQIRSAFFDWPGIVGQDRLDRDAKIIFF